MLSLKPSNDQSIRKFKVDVIPTIDLESELQTLCSTFETINSILRSGESHQKLECVKRVILAGYTKNKSEADNYVTALIESKVFGKYSSIVKILTHKGSKVTFNVSRQWCLHVLLWKKSGKATKVLILFKRSLAISNY